MTTIRNMKNIDKTVADRVNDAVKHHFRIHGITHREAAERLGYSCANVVDNLLSSGRFGKRTAEKWAKEFGFSEKFLLTGKGRLTVRRSGYQKLVYENESQRNIINAQRVSLSRLREENESLKALVSTLKGEATASGRA